MMSFLKISDPAKRDLMVKEYLELKKNILDNLLSERTGEQQLQTDLSKFYRPITETQKATTKEITEGLKPIREGIEKLPQAITFPPTQPIGEASGEEEEYEEEEEDELIDEIAKKYLNRPNTDKTFRVRKIGDHHYIGDKHVIIKDDDIIVGNDRFIGTPGLWGLITSKNLDKVDYDKMDKADYENLMIKTNALHRDNNKKKNPTTKAVGVINGMNYLAPCGKSTIKKGMRERVSLLFRVILMRC